MSVGYARQGQSETQMEIVKRLPEIFLVSETVKQKELENKFKYHFHSLSKQRTAVEHPRSLLCYSASLSTDLIATYLSTRNITVGLLHPCFDNLSTLLKRRNVRTIPVSEDELSSNRLSMTLQYLKADALFFTLPNNPTGFSFSREDLETIILLCKHYNKMLILDCTFRFYSEEMFWDQYELLESSGVSYFVIEDTGKTWPTQDLKASLLASSEDLFEGILELHNDILLNVSPFTINLLIEYLIDTKRVGLEQSLWSVIARNRRLLQEVLEPFLLDPVNKNAKVSVEWIKILNPAIDSMKLVEMLGQFDIGVTPGNHFFWNNPKMGERYIRIALARGHHQFQKSCDAIHRFLKETPAMNAVEVGD